MHSNKALTTNDNLQTFHHRKHLFFHPDQIQQQLLITLVLAQKITFHVTEISKVLRGSFKEIKRSIL